MRFAVVRRLYFYGIAFISFIVGISALDNLLRILADFWLESPALYEINRDRYLVDTVARQGGLLLVATPIFVLHWRYIQTRLVTDEERQAGLRKFFLYAASAVAATGLGLLWFGAADIIQILLEAVLGTGASTPGGPFWPEPLANGLSLLAVGAPIWAAHWRAVQGIARRQDRAGLAERSAAPRKVYLYGVALVGALLILFYLAQAVYRLLLWLLGDPEAGFFSATTAEEVARSMLAAILWAVHVMAIRDDGRLGTEGEPEEESPMDRAEILRRQIARLEAELAHARAELEALEQK
ncbi:hypothetical protein RY27_17370 [Litorilinea aerophila]|nr:hypothetical protein RY27_17370 [Litorilinea aerophila]